MRRLVMILGLMMVLAKSALAFAPAGWVYCSYPWAYDSATRDWYWFNTTGTQWVRNMNNGQWARLPNSALASGWCFYAYGYAYAQGNGSWNWINEGDRHLAVNMRTGVWERFWGRGVEWYPGRFVGPVTMGATYASVLSTMGAPTEVRYTGDPGDITPWTDYDDQRLMITYTDENGNDTLDAGDTVDGIFADNLFGTPPNWTYQGLTFGSSLAAAQSIFGLQDSDPGQSSAWWWEYGTMLYFGDNGLSQIYVFPPF